MSRVTDKQLIEFITRKNLPPSDPNNISREQVHAFFRGRLVPKYHEYLQLVSEGVLGITACEGNRTLAYAIDVFEAGIHSNLLKYETDKPGVATTTKKTKLSVYEIVRKGAFSELYGSIHEDMNRLCLTQHQIVTFCKTYRGWFRKDGDATDFLFKVEDRFYVADVTLFTSGLDVCLYMLGEEESPNSSRFLVVPIQTV